MADEIMTATTEFDAAIPEIWSRRFYPVLVAQLPMNDSVAREYDGDIQQLGDTVNVTSWPEFDAATELAEGQRNDADAVTASKTQLVINKMLVKDFIITKRSQIQSIDSMMALGDLAVFSIMKKMQSNLFTDTVPSSSSPDHQVSFASGTTLALADILGAKELLDTANVPEAGRVMVVGPAQSNDLFNITGFMSRDFIPSASSLSSGAISTPIAGFQFKWTTEAGNVARFFHPSYMQVAVQLNPEIEVVSKGVEGQRAWRTNVTFLYGQKQFDNKRVVSVS